MNWKTFFICGLTGWCMEILFTSLGGLLRGDLLLNGHTSIWMFPIYGLAAVIGPLSVRLRHGLCFCAAVFTVPASCSLNLSVAVFLGFSLYVPGITVELPTVFSVLSVWTIFPYGSPPG